MGPAVPQGGHRRLPEPAPAPPPLPRPPPPSPLKNPGTCVSSHLTIAPPLIARPGTRERAAAGLAPPRPSLACLVDPARPRARASRSPSPRPCMERKGKREKEKPVEVGETANGSRAPCACARRRARAGVADGSWATAPPVRVARAPSSGPALSQPLGSREVPLSQTCSQDQGAKLQESWKVPCSVFVCESRVLSPTLATSGRLYFSLFFRVRRETPAPFVANISTSARGSKSGS